MREMERRIALLRLLLADITARERQAREAQDQLRGQLTRIVDFTVRQNAGVSHSLTAMEEVEERLAQQETILRHLALLRGRAQRELQALLVTRGVAEAHNRLAELETRRATLLSPGQTDAPHDEVVAIDAEIVELQGLIQQASEAAARSLTQELEEWPPGLTLDQPRDQSRQER